MSQFVDSLYNILSQRKGKSYAGYPVYNISKSDIREIEAVALSLGFPAEWLSNVINFESAATFNPAITNSIGATGLIQFLPSTAKSLGTSTEALRKMSFKEQMQYVKKYLTTVLASRKQLENGKVKKDFTQQDLFMTIFYPVAIGNPNFNFPDSVTRNNPNIYTPKDYTKKALMATTAPFSDYSYSIRVANEYKWQIGLGFALFVGASFLFWKFQLIKDVKKWV